MRINTAVTNRQALALFNFMSMKQKNDKRIGDLTVKDFAEMCAFLGKLQTEKAIACNSSNDNKKNNKSRKGKK